MDLAEFIKRFREEFKAVKDIYEEPTDRELALMFINNIVMAKFQIEDLKKQKKLIRRKYHG